MGKDSKPRLFGSEDLNNIITCTATIKLLPLSGSALLSDFEYICSCSVVEKIQDSRLIVNTIYTVYSVLKRHFTQAPHGACISIKWGTRTYP